MLYISLCKIIILKIISYHYNFPKSALVECVCIYHYTIYNLFNKTVVFIDSLQYCLIVPDILTVQSLAIHVSSRLNNLFIS